MSSRNSSQNELAIIDGNFSESVVNRVPKAVDVAANLFSFWPHFGGGTAIRFSV